MSEQTPTIKVNPNKILIVLLIVAGVLVSLSIWGQHIKYYPGSIDIRGPLHEYFLDLLMKGFYVDNEANIPTYFNTIILFIPSFLLAIIGAWKKTIGDKFRFAWIGLSIVFLLLSIDEAAVLHETLIKPMRSLFNYEGYGGLFYFAWVIPGLGAVLLFVITYFRFFLHLSNKYKILFAASLLIYVSGVIGGEMLSGHFADTIGFKNFIYAKYTSLEESLEWIGAIMIIYSLLRYMKEYLPEGIKITGA